MCVYLNCENTYIALCSLDLSSKLYISIHKLPTVKPTPPEFHQKLKTQHTSNEYFPPKSYYPAHAFLYLFTWLMTLHLVHKLETSDILSCSVPQQILSSLSNLP